MSVIAALEQLPRDGATVKALQTLDKVVPGHWENITSMEGIVRSVAQVDNPKVLRLIAKQAAAFDKRKPQYRQALKVYQLVDTADQVAAGAAVASQAAGLLGALTGGRTDFLKKVTPKPETTQAIDAGLKLVAEVVAYGLMNGMPKTDAKGLARFAVSLHDYGKYDLARISAWVVFDGMLPLGPRFIERILKTWQTAASGQLTQNPIFDKLADRLPGDSPTQKQGFIVDAIGQTGQWVGEFVKEKGITQKGVMKQVQGAVGVAGGAAPVVAAAIDASTAYYSHTGTQTVARTLARHGLQAVQQQVWDQWVAGQ